MYGTGFLNLGMIPGLPVGSGDGEDVINGINFDFKNGIYRRRAEIKTDILDVAGATHIQAGACWEFDSLNRLQSFAQNKPRVASGVGFHARRGFRNEVFASSGAVSMATTSGTGTATEGFSSPDGTLNATKYSGAVNGYRQANRPTVANTSYTYGVFVKTVAGGLIDVLIGATPSYTGGFIGSFNPVTGDITTVAGVLNKLQLANGWWFIWSTFSVTVDGTGFTRLLSKDVDGYYWFHVQYTIGTQVGPLIVSNGSQGTNGAQRLDVTYAPNQDDFVAFASVDTTQPFNSVSRVAFALSNGSSTNRIRVGFLSSSGASYLEVRSNDTGVLTVAGISGHVYGAENAVLGIRRRAGKYSLIEQYGVNAPAATPEYEVAAPIGIDRIELGHSLGGVQLGGILKRFVQVDGAFTDAEFSAMALSMAA